MSLKDLLFQWAEEKAAPDLSFLNFNFTDVITIGGLRDAGKSFFLNKLVDACSRYVLWDYRYERVVKITPFTSKKAKLINDKTIKITSQIGDIGKYNKIIFHPYATNKEEMMKLFDNVAKAVRNSGNYVFAVEEADSMADRFHPLESGLFELIQGNLHVGCGLVFLTRRLQNLNPDIVRQSDKLVLFKYSQKDKHYLEEFLGVDELKPQIADRQFYVYDGHDCKFYEGLHVS